MPGSTSSWRVERGRCPVNEETCEGLAAAYPLVSQVAPDLAQRLTAVQVPLPHRHDHIQTEGHPRQRQAQVDQGPIQLARASTIPSWARLVPALLVPVESLHIAIPVLADHQPALAV